jgi:hypothetical protein
MLIRIFPEADAELTEAREWYSQQRANLDLEFMENIDDALSRILSDPHLYPIVYNVAVASRLIPTIYPLRAYQHWGIGAGTFLKWHRSLT